MRGEITAHAAPLLLFKQIILNVLQHQQQQQQRKVANPSLQVEPQIQFALALDLGRRPRMNRSGTTQIVVHKQRQAKQVERLMIITTAKLWGWEDDSLSSKRRVRIARAVCKQVAYDHGYERPITHNMLSKWEQSLRSAVLNGSEDVANDVLSPQVGGSKQYLDMIERKKTSSVFGRIVPVCTTS